MLSLVTAILASAPAQGDVEPGAYDAWVTHEDSSDAGAGDTFSWSGPDDGLLVSPYAGPFGQLGVYSSRDVSHDQELDATFIPPSGETLRAGVTYRADTALSDPTPTTGRLSVWRDGTMCGKSWDEIFDGPIRSRSLNPATGTFHIIELERDDLGAVTRFSATFELNCQSVGSQPGFQGSIAVNATMPPASVPAAPATPGPVTDLMSANVGPNGSGESSTTLTWTNPADAVDVDIDMVQSSDHAKLPADISTDFYQLYRGRANSWRARTVDFMDTRTYRVVPRGPTGRLGPASLVTVLGTRLTIPDATDKVTIGQTVRFSGRLSQSADYIDVKDIMKGPGLVGRVVLLCSQSSKHYVDGACTPVDRTRTTTDGRFSLSATPMENTIYDIVVPATARMVGNAGRVVNALVAPRADLTAPESVPVAARTSIARGIARSAIIHFSTSRARAGSRGLVRLQRLDGRTWRTIATRTLTTRGVQTRRLAIPYRERRRGLHAYRVVKLGDANHINGYSRTVRVRVR